MSPSPTTPTSGPESRTEPDAAGEETLPLSDQPDGGPATSASLAEDAAGKAESSSNIEQPLDARENGDHGWFNSRPRRLLRTLAILLLLLAVVLLAVDLSRSGPRKSAASRVTQPTTSLSVAPPSASKTTIPPVVVPSVPKEPASSQAPVASPAPNPPTAASASELCTPADLELTTYTDKASYAPGQAVSLATTISDIHPCSFRPVFAGAFDCPTSLTVASSSGQQEWPAPGGKEQCSYLAAGTLHPGRVATVTSTWNGKVERSGGNFASAPGGTYVAVAQWAFATGSAGATTVVTAKSTPFSY